MRDIIPLHSEPRLSDSDRFKAIVDIKDTAQTLGLSHDPAFCADLAFCMSKNPAIADHFIAKTRAKLHVRAMKTALDKQAPTWGFVRPGSALNLGEEVISAQTLQIEKDTLARGVTLICGTATDELYSYLAHLLDQLL